MFSFLYLRTHVLPALSRVLKGLMWHCNTLSGLGDSRELSRVTFSMFYVYTWATDSW